MTEFEVVAVVLSLVLLGVFLWALGEDGKS